MATYRHDPDLEFLRHCHRDDLDLLVSVLICDPKDGLARITETLTYDPQYKNTSPTTRATGMPSQPRFRRLVQTASPRCSAGVKGCCTGKFLPMPAIK